MIQRSFDGINTEKNPEITKDEYFQRIGHIESRNLIAKISKENGAVIIDPIEFFIQNKHIKTSDENGPIRYDDRHLRPEWVKKNVTYLDFIF
jgi:hypothetical protein